MELNLFKNIVNEMKKIDISEFIKEISERLEKMEKELVIDRFEGNIAICEDRKTGKIIEINKDNISEKCKEGDIIKEHNGKYIIFSEQQEITENRIKNKMNKLWKD